MDFGPRRIGLAVSDETGTIARPLRTLRIERVREAPEAVAEAVRAEAAAVVVVGVPEGLEGEERRPQSRRVVRFAKAVRALTGVVVHLQDESLSSREARSLGGRPGRGSPDAEHARAAAVVLQRWLDGRSRAAELDAGAPGPSGGPGQGGEA
ncbi:MAG TPA: Holliday junction resolvase RuvX [Acidobacteriota bacterium]|nr:Holliday junction resolvase RuvX [Acidobacteriota bacterium]